MSTFISRDCENPEIIAGWLDYMTSEEGMLLWDFGIEGIDYVLDEEGLVVRTREGKEKRENYSTSGLMAWWMFVNYSWERHVMQAPREGEELQEYEIYTAYGRTEETVIYDEAVLSIPSETLSEEAQSIQLAVNELKSTWLPLLVLAEDEASFETGYDQFLTGLREAGIEILDTEKDEQYEKNCEQYGYSLEKINP